MLHFRAELESITRSDDRKGAVLEFYPHVDDADRLDGIDDAGIRFWVTGQRATEFVVGKTYDIVISE